MNRPPPHGRAPRPVPLALALLALLAPGCGGAADAVEPSQDGGAGDGAAAVADSGKPQPLLGEPLGAPTDGTWTWIPIEGTQCADGTEAGVGVNFTDQSRDLVVWFQGNGVCYSEGSCTLFGNLLTGMGADPLAHLWWNDPLTPITGIFDRGDETNPFRESNFVAFPHCGVDGHTSDRDVTYPAPVGTVHQHGYGNVTRALPRILATFQDATRVVIAGFSAGAIGAAANYHQIATGFEGLGHPPPYLVADAGPILPPPHAGEKATTALREGWGLASTIDTWCAPCAAEGYHVGYREIARLHPGVRASIISAYGDGIATALYQLLKGGEPFDAAGLEAGLRALTAWSAGYQAELAPSTQREFYYPGGRHGALAVGPLGLTPGLSDFLDGQLGVGAGWQTIAP